jgi:4-hydroxy-tetrahydrodipicolinate synthase
VTRDDIDWTGAIPAVTTPFDAAGAVDLAAFAANVDRLIGLGATGVIACGCTGEFWALTLEEKAALARAAVEAVAGRGPVILGAAAIRVEDALAIAEAAAAAGCAAALVTPPYFVRTTSAETEAHVAAIAARAPLPLVLYNIPGNAVNAVSPALAARLAKLETVVAIKESSGDWRNFHETLIAARERIRVFCGPSSQYGAAAAAAGADGFMDCFPNVWAGCLDLWPAARDGRPEARALQETALALTALFTGEGRTLYPATKAAMDHLGLPGGGAPRPPLRPLEGPALDGLIAGLDRLIGAGA